MSKLAERVPAMADTASKIELVNGVIGAVSSDDGRINFRTLVDEVEKKIVELDVNEDVIVREGRKSAAQQVASAWANLRTIKIDRTQRRPVYQAQISFAEHYFKIGSQFVPAASMTAADFETMLSRQEQRLENARTDHTIWQEFFERARPGLERGENLVQQFEIGSLELVAGDGAPELEEETS